MNKMQLISIVHTLLDVDSATLGFLDQLSQENLETLVACIRQRIDLSQDQYATMSVPSKYREGVL